MKSSGWKDLKRFYSLETSQKFLFQQYEKRNIQEANQQAYKNCERFIYFLKHGHTFYDQAASAPLELKPILLFYGMAQLLKACLLTVDPDYPSQTSVLAHGVTSRKRKKQHYRFSEDEVKIQRNGLCMHVLKHLFHLNGLEDERFTMINLLSKIPEMGHILEFQKQPATLVKVEQANGILIQDHIPLLYNMSAERFIEYFEFHTTWKLKQREAKKLTFDVFSEENPALATHLHYDLEMNQWFIPATRDAFLGIPEIISHYLLMYNLSMIARYETEWWYELLSQYISDDYVMIERYMEIAEDKFPAYIMMLLEENTKKTSSDWN
ncbi:hypothetical protein DAD80_18410 [Bacillus altitudinis]|uniref:YaaC family protein n=2 Tax=Bacillus altitudinis TaxID=293387 RepID=UPI000D38AB1D|nr:YaaC family protein [Bacillus altitudinis]PUF85885.1 hypothetical protein DAD80_18410 [Bacillus altitudinis]PWN86344.1 hypothetical protein CTM99_00600 [Bacillus altitudinis]